MEDVVEDFEQPDPLGQDYNGISSCKKARWPARSPRPASTLLLTARKGRQALFRAAEEAVRFAAEGERKRKGLNF